MIGTLERKSGQYNNQLVPEKGDSTDIDIDALVSMAQNGQAEAFGLLYEEFIERIYRYVYIRIGHTRQAEDMTQEVFLRAYEKITDYRCRGIPFMGWLLRIAHNLIVDFYRRENKRQFVPLDETWVPSTDNPVAQAEDNLDIIEIRKAMNRLPASQKEAFNLRFVAGLTVSETAKVMDKSEGAVKTLQHEAVVKLRRIMREK